MKQAQQLNVARLWAELVGVICYFCNLGPSEQSAFVSSPSDAGIGYELPAPFLEECWSV